MAYVVTHHTHLLTSYNPLENISLIWSWIIILLVRGYKLISIFSLAKQKVSLYSFSRNLLLCCFWTKRTKEIPEQCMNICTEQNCYKHSYKEERKICNPWKGLSKVKASLLPNLLKEWKSNELSRQYLGLNLQNTGLSWHNYFVCPTYFHSILQR